MSYTSNTKFKVLSAVAAVAGGLAIAGQADASVLSIGASSAQAPASVPTITVAPGGALSFSIWGQAQGSGYLQAASIGVYQSSVESWGGGTVSATSTLASSSFFTLGTASYSSNIATIFGQTRNSYNTTAVTGASLVLANLGGSNLSQPTTPITSAAAQLIATVTGTVGLTPGTYYLYLGRTGSGISESPAFKVASSDGGVGTAASVTNTTQFGFGDASPVATAGSGANGTVANTLSRNADAIIVVKSAVAPNSLDSQAAGTVLGTATSNGSLSTGYSFGTANTSGAASGSVKIEGSLASTTGPVLVYLDLASGSASAAAAAIAAGIGAAGTASAVSTTIGGTTYDVLVTFSSNPAVAGSLYYNFDLSGAGGTVASVAVVPEPAGLAGLALAAVPALRRRRR